MISSNSSSALSHLIYPSSFCYNRACQNPVAICVVQLKEGQAMVSETKSPMAQGPAPDELQALHDHWLLFLILGSAVILLGLLAITFSFFTTLATVALFGTFLLLGGAMHLVNAVTGKNWRG